MDGESVLIAFIVFLSLQHIFDICLTVLNIRYSFNSGVQALPEQLKDLYDQQLRTKSREYSSDKAYLSILSSLYFLAIIILLSASGAFAHFDVWLSKFNLSALLHGTAYLTSCLFFFSFLALPFSYYSTFKIEEKFGFNQTTRGLWIKDQLLGFFINLLVSAPLIFILLYLMKYFQGSWWIYAAITLIIIQLFLAYVFPIWIAPLFNKFTKLDEPGLNDEINKLVERVGYRVAGVYLMDGSKRSKHANAYFAGIGKSKRIVLYDTLTHVLKIPELLAVLAHEIGHEKLGHIKKSLIFSSLIIFAGFYLLDFFYTSEIFYTAFGFSGRSDHAALLIFMLLSGPMMYLISPMFNLVSRKFEFEADKFAVEAVGESNLLANALMMLSKNSLSNLAPHPLYSFMHYSHPVLAERIRAMGA